MEINRTQSLFQSHENIKLTTIATIFHSFQEPYFTGQTSRSKLCPAPSWSSSTKQSARLTTSQHRTSPY